MTYIILTAIFLVGICSLINSYIDNHRQIAFNKMNLIYDKMELSMATNNVSVNSSTAKFLKSHKSYVVNNEWADIHILLLVRIQITEVKFEKQKAEYNETLKLVPEDIKKLAQEFSKETDKAIALSIFRLEFLAYFVYIFVRFLFISILERSSKSIRALFKNLSDLFKYENVVISNCH